jgi:DNA-directed RNA polymerase subunit RPC12/RpoP
MMIEYTHFKCNQCGSDLDYAIGLHSLKCVSCGEVDPIEASPLDMYLAHDYKAAISDLSYFDPQQVSHELKCDNCGANFMLPVNVHAEECPYCDLNVVVPVDLSRKLMPDGVMPFMVQQHEAAASFKKMARWLVVRAKCVETQSNPGATHFGCLHAFVGFRCRSQQPLQWTTGGQLPHHHAGSDHGQWQNRDENQNRGQNQMAPCLR